MPRVTLTIECESMQEAAEFLLAQTATPVEVKTTGGFATAEDKPAPEPTAEPPKVMPAAEAEVKSSKKKATKKKVTKKAAPKSNGEVMDADALRSAAIAYAKSPEGSSAKVKEFLTGIGGEGTKITDLDEAGRKQLMSDIGV